MVDTGRKNQVLINKNADRKITTIKGGKNDFQHAENGFGLKKIILTANFLSTVILHTQINDALTSFANSGSSHFILKSSIFIPILIK